MNPYLKANGSGFLDDAFISEASDKLLSSSVGDGGASWRLKALKRAKEQAAREGRKLDEVVEERWRSLDHLMAGCRAAPVHAHLLAVRDRRKGQTELSEEVPSDEIKPANQEVYRGNREYLHYISSRNPEVRKPRHDLSWKRIRSCNMPVEDKSLISSAIYGLNKFGNDGSFMDNIAHIQSKDKHVSNSSSRPSQKTNEEREKSECSKQRDSDEVLPKKQHLSANQLAAKVLQLRMKERHEEAEKLSKEMQVMAEQQDGGAKTVRVKTSRYPGEQISSEYKRIEEDVDLHLAKTIIQSKQYSLVEEDEYGFDVPASRNRKKKKEVPEGSSAFKRLVTQQERCQFCFENPARPKYLEVSIGNYTRLTLPQWQPVVTEAALV